MSAYLQKQKRKTLQSRHLWDTVRLCYRLDSYNPPAPIYPANAVRATQEYGDQEMTYSRMTIRAIFAIFHSFCSRWKFFIESCLLPWLWTLPLTFPTALTHTQQVIDVVVCTHDTHPRHENTHTN